MKGTCRRARHCKIVLARTGLDDIDGDFLEVVIPKKVDFTSSAFKQVLESQHIKKEEMPKGTISSVLAENEMRATIVRVRRSVSQEFTTN